MVEQPSKNQNMQEAQKIAEILSKLSPKVKEVVLNQMYIAIAICQSVEQLFSEETKV